MSCCRVSSKTLAISRNGWASATLYKTSASGARVPRTTQTLPVFPCTFCAAGCPTQASFAWVGVLLLPLSPAKVSCALANGRLDEVSHVMRGGGCCVFHGRTQCAAREKPVASSQLPAVSCCQTGMAFDYYLVMHLLESSKARRIFTHKSLEWNILRGKVFSVSLFSLSCRGVGEGGVTQVTVIRP